MARANAPVFSVTSIRNWHRNELATANNGCTPLLLHQLSLLRMQLNWFPTSHCLRSTINKHLHHCPMVQYTVIIVVQIVARARVGEGAAHQAAGGQTLDPELVFLPNSDSLSHRFTQHPKRTLLVARETAPVPEMYSSMKRESEGSSYIEPYQKRRREEDLAGSSRPELEGRGTGMRSPDRLSQHSGTGSVRSQKREPLENGANFWCFFTPSACGSLKIRPAIASPNGHGLLGKVACPVLFGKTGAHQRGNRYRKRCEHAGSGRDRQLEVI